MPPFLMVDFSPVHFLCREGNGIILISLEQRSHDTDMHPCINLLAWRLSKTVLSFEIMKGQ